MSALLSRETLNAILDADDSELAAVARFRMERLHTDSELEFLLKVLRELGRRSLDRRGASWV